MFFCIPDCSGKCKNCLTHYTGGCIAGSGDDDFNIVDQESFDWFMNNKHLSDEKKIRLAPAFPEFEKNYKKPPPEPSIIEQVVTIPPKNKRGQ